MHGFGTRTHHDDNAFRLGMAGVVEQAIRASSDPGKPVHHRLYDRRAIPVKWIGGFPRLEIDVGVHGGAAYAWIFRRQGPLAVFADPVIVYHRANRFIGHGNDFLNFMRRPETVEKVEEGNSRFERCRVGNEGEVHGFLNVAGCEHRESGRAGGHHIAVVAENRKRLRGQRPCRHVNDERVQFARDFVHVRNHKQQSLGRRERRRQRAGLQRAVHRTRGASFALEFDHVGYVAP